MKIERETRRARVSRNLICAEALAEAEALSDRATCEVSSISAARSTYAGRSAFSSRLPATRRQIQAQDIGDAREQVRGRRRAPSHIVLSNSLYPLSVAVPFGLASP